MERRVLKWFSKDQFANLVADRRGPLSDREKLIDCFKAESKEQDESDEIETRTIVRRKDFKRKASIINFKLTVMVVSVRLKVRIILVIIIVVLTFLIFSIVVIRVIIVMVHSIFHTQRGLVNKLLITSIMAIRFTSRERATSSTLDLTVNLESVKALSA